MATAFALSACGGGGGGGNTPTVQMPDNPPMQNDNGETMTPPPDETMTPPDETPTPPDETTTPPPDETTTPPPDETMTPPPDETTTPPVYDTAEFRGNYALARMGALHAYNSGYHGQSVTVMVPESDVRHTHTALSPNIITLSGAIGNLWDTPKSDRLLRHGTNVAGILGAAREIGEMHGVAPSVKMVFPADDLDYAPNNDIPIISNSSGAAFSGITELDDLAVITTSGTVLGTFNEWANRRNRQLGNSDTIWVNSNGNDGWNTLHSTLNVPNFEGLLPLVHQRMADNIIVVGNLNTLTLAAGRTNGCGVAMMWCVFAFGVDHRTTDSDSDTDYTRATLFTGTSAAAPHVAGALAVLKSAADMLVPQMSAMTTVRLILLETATPLYADASKNGVRIMENGEPVLSSVYGWGAVNIGAGITHLQGIANQMSSIKQMQVARLGGAAKLANGNKFAPANDKNTFRFWGGIETENAWTGIATQEYSGVSGFAEYGKANMRINSFLTNGEIRNAESQSWTAGIQFGDLIRHNDNLRFSAREESRISDGELILQYSFGKQIRIPIKQKPQTIYTAGYSQKTENSKWSAAAEWNSATNAKGFSFAVELQIR